MSQSKSIRIPLLAAALLAAGTFAYGAEPPLTLGEAQRAALER